MDNNEKNKNILPSKEKSSLFHFKVSGLILFHFKCNVSKQMKPQCNGKGHIAC